jgi:hypothetical protein
MTESQRVWKEFQRLYELKPKLNVRANDELFLARARQESGDTDSFTADSAILWMDEPDFRNKLATLDCTPSEAVDEFLANNPGYRCSANREMILAHLRNVVATPQAIAHTVDQLRHQLSFDSAAAAQHEQELREERQAEDQDFLINRASPSELRARARWETEQRRAEAIRQEDQRKIAYREQLDAQAGYQPLPATDQLGRAIDSAYLIRLSNADRYSTEFQRFKNYIKVFGAANVTARLRGIR